MVEFLTKQPDKIGKYGARKTTQEHYDIYQDEVNKQMKMFGMGDMDYSFQCIKDKAYKAACAYTMDHRCCFTLATEWMGVGDITEAEIRSVARHEVAHALISRIHLMGVNRSYDEESMTNEVEAYAHRMEKYMTDYALILEKLEGIINSLQEQTIKVEECYVKTNTEC